MNERHPATLLYFDQRLVHHYEPDPGSYLVRENSINITVESRIDPWFSVSAGFRTMADGNRCLVVLDSDFYRLPANEQSIWSGFRLHEPTFQQTDPRFDDWWDANFELRYDVDTGALPRIKQSVELLRAISLQRIGEPLYRSLWNDLITYPSGENNESYASAHLELYRVVIDGINAKALTLIGQRTGRNVTDPNKTLNSLKEILPADRVNIIHTPLKKVRDERNPKHGVPSSGVVPFPARATFESDIAALAEGLESLSIWLADVLDVDATCCLERQQMIENGPWPRFAGPPKIERKQKEVDKAAGKTIDRIEFGVEEREQETAELEAMVFHFTDGTAMSIDITTNVERLLDGVDMPRPRDVQVGLRAFWIPAIRSDTNK